MIVSHRRARAFTLVELLVVIGIIAALIGILLPVLSGVSARGRDIKCQSNLRQIVQSVFTYCAENKGSMPYGFYWDPSLNDNPDPAHSSNTWGPKNGTDHFISWSAQISRYMTRKSGGDNYDDFPPVLQCPEAAQSRNHVVGYVMNMIVGVYPFNERVMGLPPRAQVKPPNQTLMLKETALFWDTAIRPNWENNVGYSVGADIDDQRFWQGARTPQWRYFSTKDILGQIPPGVMGQNKPVLLNVGSNIFYNRDQKDGESFPFQGNLRFRHNKNTACNVGFSDGSVRQFTAKLQSDGLRVQSHDALRRYFMIKWPSGVPVDESRPF